MSFLAPIFLIGGLLVAAPVVLHLVRRSSRERTSFSSLMFLRPVPPTLTRRSRLEDLLLLFLRCALLVLLGVAFARPFWKVGGEEGVAGPAAVREVVVLLDTSASMRREGLWQGALERLERVASDLMPADGLSVWLFDREVRSLVDSESWLAVPAADRPSWLRGRVRDVAPGWGGSYLDLAMVEAAELLASGTDRGVDVRREIVVISDMQEGVRLRQLQGHEWPGGVEVRLEPVEGVGGSNAGLQLLGGMSMQGADEGAGQAVVRVRVENERGAEKEQFQLSWFGEGAVASGGGEIQVHVPAGQSRVVRVPVEGGEVLSGGVRLVGDDADFDNRLFAARPEARLVRVLYVGSEAGSDATRARFFLERALRDTAFRRVEIETRPGVGGDIFGDMSGVSLVVVRSALSAGAARSLGEWVRAGNVVLWVPEGVESGVETSAGLGFPEWFREEVQPKDYMMLGSIDYRHPLLAPFTEARYSDFTPIHFWRYRRLAPELVEGASVVAAFDNGDAFLVDVPLGGGRVYVMTSGWQPVDSQLGVSTKFVPLMYRVLELAGGVEARGESLVVGDRLMEEGIEVRDSVGRLLEPGEGGGYVMAEPGIYEVKRGDTVERLVVNLEPAEVRTTVMEAEQLEAVGVPMVRSEEEVRLEESRAEQLSFSEMESRQKVWKWLILLAVGVVVVETWLAARGNRPQRKAVA